MGADESKRNRDGGQKTSETKIVKETGTAVADPKKEKPIMERSKEMKQKADK